MHDLVMLDFFLCHFDEMAFEGALGRVRNLVDEAPEGFTVRHDLQNLDANFVQEFANFCCLGKLRSQGRDSEE